MVPERPLEPEVLGLVLEDPGLSEGRAARARLLPGSALVFSSPALMAVSVVQCRFWESSHCASMSRPSSRAIYRKCPLWSALSFPPGTPTLRGLPPTPSHPPPPVADQPPTPPHPLGSSPSIPLLHSPAVQRKDYVQAISSEPTCLQHRVEVSNPGPVFFAQDPARQQEDGLWEDSGS